MVLSLKSWFDTQKQTLPFPPPLSKKQIGGQNLLFSVKVMHAFVQDTKICSCCFCLLFLVTRLDQPRSVVSRHVNAKDASAQRQNVFQVRENYYYYYCPRISISVSRTSIMFYEYQFTIGEADLIRSAAITYSVCG